MAAETPDPNLDKLRSASHAELIGTLSHTLEMFELEEADAGVSYNEVLDACTGFVIAAQDINNTPGICIQYSGPAVSYLRSGESFEYTVDAGTTVFVTDVDDELVSVIALERATNNVLNIDIDIADFREHVEIAHIDPDTAGSSVAEIAMKGMLQPPSSDLEVEMLQASMIQHQTKLQQAASAMAAQLGLAGGREDSFDWRTYNRHGATYREVALAVSNEPHLTLAYTGLVISERQDEPYELEDQPIHIISIGPDHIIAVRSPLVENAIDILEIEPKDVYRITVRPIDYELSVPTSDNLIAQFAESEAIVEGATPTLPSAESVADDEEEFRSSFDDYIGGYPITATPEEFLSFDESQIAKDAFFGRVLSRTYPEQGTTSATNYAIGDILAYIDYTRRTLIDRDRDERVALQNAATYVLGELCERYGQWDADRPEQSPYDMVKMLYRNLRAIAVEDYGEENYNQHPLIRGFLAHKWKGQPPSS